jgi:Zn-dependent M28 family amino/carboxypeptidase
MRRATLAIGTLSLLVVGLIAQPVAQAGPGVDSTELRDAVTVEGVREHQSALQAIADANGGTRASGTPGYEASVDYVVERLEAAGYTPEVQAFEFPFFQELAPPVLEQVSPDPTVYAEGDDFFTMTYSGSGDVTAVAQAVDIILPPPPEPSSTSGCEESDFAGFTAGNIALIQRGTCTFQVKAENAQAAGAAGVIIFNEGQEGRQDALLGTLGEPTVTIPVVGTSFAVGEDLANPADTVVHMDILTASDFRTTWNVIADTASGRGNRIVVAGAHLDSVLPGPGINDNGSGSGVLLEIAEEFSELGIQPRNKVRFAWWGAEELGLLGSEHYVSLLSKRDIKNIQLNLNFDMVGSPNFVRFTFDGDGSDNPGLEGPNGSANIEQVFLKYFASQDLAVDPTPFNNRSDYASFTAVGIPAGGLFTGAEGIKTEEQAEIYGGDAGIAYDPCYHQACDTFDNVDLTGLDQMADGTAHGILTFAMTKSAVNGTDKGKALGHDDSEFLGPELQL